MRCIRWKRGGCEGGSEGSRSIRRCRIPSRGTTRAAKGEWRSRQAGSPPGPLERTSSSGGEPARSDKALPRCRSEIRVQWGRKLFHRELSLQLVARRCPECYAELPDNPVWVCPTCGYTLRTPAAAKAGIVFMVLGLVLLGAFVYGPDRIGLTSGLVPTDLANLTIANFPLLVLGTFGIGAFLVAAAALQLL